MKTPIVFFITMIISASMVAQSFVLPIYLTNGINQKDTVYISGDLTASTNLDSGFGEVDLNGIPYDSTFEARLTTDVFSSTRIETKKQALFYECPTVWAGNLQQNPILVRCKSWPLTVKWDRNLIDSVPLCIQVSGVSNMLEYFGNGSPQYHLSDRDSVNYNQNQLFTPYNEGTNNGQSAPIYVIAVGISGDGSVGFEDVVLSHLTLAPNPATNQLFIQTNGMAVSEVNIYNTTGSLVSQTKQPQTNSIDISQLANGVYIAEIKTKEASVMRRWVKM